MSSPFTLPLHAVLLLGPTGSGKSPLGDHLAIHGLFGKRCFHLDFGSHLRSLASDISSTLPLSSEERSFIRAVLEQGLLLENERFPLARKIILHALSLFGFSDADLLVLNGIPRHAGQARDISSLASVHALIVLDCPSESVRYRLRDNTGGDRDGRTDDHQVLVEKKLRTFHARTEPLIRHYERNAGRIYRIPVDQQTTTADAYRSLLSLSAAYPPVSFVPEPPQR